MFGQDLLSKFREAFLTSRVLHRQVYLQSKEFFLFGLFTSCSLVLPPEMASLKESMTHMEIKTWAA